MATVLEVNDLEFADSVKSGVVLADFYGTYCPPCKLLEPVMEKLAEDYDGRARVVKVNVDDSPDAAVDNGIEDIPTVVIFKDGEEKARLFGAQSIETLQRELDKLV